MPPTNRSSVEAVSTALAAKASRAEVLDTVEGKVGETRAALEKAIETRATTTQLMAAQVCERGTHTHAHPHTERKTRRGPTLSPSYP